jgi:hypothetical protein
MTSINLLMPDTSAASSQMSDMAIYQQSWFSFSFSALAEIVIEPLYIRIRDGSAALNTRPTFFDTHMPE